MNRIKRQRWYSYDGQNRSRAYSHERSTGPKRVASLVILLFLVLILIRLTSDTERVERAATVIGLLPVAPKSTVESTVAVQGTNNRFDTDVRRRIAFQMANEQRYLDQMSMSSAEPRINLLRDAWIALMDHAPKQVINLLACKTFANNDPIGTKVDNSESLHMLQEWYDHSRHEISKWKKTEIENLVASKTQGFSPEMHSPLPELEAWLTDHEEWFQSAVRLDPSGNTEPAAVGLTYALDKKLLRQVVDFANWIPMSDHVAFQRNWQRIEQLCEWIVYRPENFSRLTKFAFGQFGTELSALRGKPIRFAGTILRIDSDDSTPNYGGFSKHSYKVIWLRPDDGSSQPIRLYVPSVFVDPMIRIQEGEDVEVGGFFFKQLAYASKRGTDVGPIVLCGYLGPKGAAISNTFDDRFSAVSLSLRDKPHWFPPMDFATPWAVIQKNLSAIIEHKNLKQQSIAADDLSALSIPILSEMQRYESFIDLLLAKQRHWSLTEDASLAIVHGWLTKVERIPIDRSRSIPGFDRSDIFRCWVKDFRSEKIHQFICSEVPLILQVPSQELDSTLHQPVLARGMSVVCEDGTSRVWSHRLDWHIPGRAFEEHVDVASATLKPDISRGQKFLLAAGWNLGWQDLLQRLQAEPVKTISSEELEPFYSLLKLAAQEPFYAHAEANKDCRIFSVNEIVETLRTNKRQQQRPVLERTAMEVRILRITNVNLTNPQHVATLGRDQYFQIDGMADIGNRTYQIPTDGEPIVYDKEYPVTLVATELPSWLGPLNSSTPEEMSLNRGDSTEPLASWNPRIKINASGWFYRFWSYKTEEITQSLGDNKRQISPLVVVDSFERLGSSQSEQQAQVDRIARIATTILGICGIAGIWWFIRKKTPRLVQRHSQKPEMDMDIFQTELGNR